MNTRLLPLVVLLCVPLAGSPLPTSSGIAFASRADEAPAKSHPLKGVVVSVLADQQALLVKHEEIPGVMRAMTMMFQVEPAVLERVKAGDAIKGLMSRSADGRWWLHAVEVTAPAGQG
ncbi:MAG: copper-binding protein [Opitutaceae bacterium]|nr:copper-binding protein [Opitutaceae bacterium]